MAIKEAVSSLSLDYFKKSCIFIISFNSTFSTAPVERGNDGID
jgi:hypothetical protein